MRVGGGGILENPMSANGSVSLCRFTLLKFEKIHGNIDSKNFFDDPSCDPNV